MFSSLNSPPEAGEKRALIKIVNAPCPFPLGRLDVAATYKQALRGLFTAGTSESLLAEKRKRSVANKD